MAFTFTGRSPRSATSAEQTQRPGRPSHPPRQTSFGKRHSSFDTPRELPFSASNSLPTASSSKSRSKLPEREGRSLPSLLSSSTQCSLQDGIVHSDLKLNGQSSSVQDRPASSITNSVTSPNAQSTHVSHMSSVVDPELYNSSQQQGSTLQGQWSSDNLRPPLLQHKQPQSLSDSSLPDFSTHSPAPSPDGMGGTGSRVVHAPLPLRLSSTDSLPLPTQTPVAALDQQRMGILLEGVPDIPHMDRLASDTNDSHDSSWKSLPSNTLNALPRVLSPPPSSDASPTVSKSSARSPLSPQTDPARVNFLSDHSEASRPYTHLSGDSTVFSSSSGSSSARTSASSTSFPPPAPPTIHTPPPPPSNGIPDGETISGQLGRRHAPHEPFLSHAPAPQECFISVGTLENEYRLSVRLPGFQQDCITLSTRRRRILHVVADSWGVNGGHFERRISFGYDADLSRVRAEFDGEHLRVVIPRQMPEGWFTPRGLD